jgi:hypothetical protein
MKCQRSVHLEQANRVRDALFFGSLLACCLGAIAKIWMRRKRAHVETPHRFGASLSVPRDGLAVVTLVEPSPRRQVARKFSDARRGHA